jgi:hypothetical protein
LFLRIRNSKNGIQPFSPAHLHLPKEYAGIKPSIRQAFRLESGGCCPSVTAMAVVADLHRTFPACVRVALDGYIINPLSVFVNIFTKFSLISVLKGGIIMARKHILRKGKTK